jgi:hypothetical protein
MIREILWFGVEIVSAFSAIMVIVFRVKNYINNNKDKNLKI